MDTIQTRPQNFTPNLNGTRPAPEERGVKEILGDLYRNSKQVAQQEMTIIKEETKSVREKSMSHLGIVVGFGALAVLSVFPFLAFFIIALGRAMDDNYWASSLIVGILCLAIGGGVAYSALKKLKASVQFPRTQSTLRRLLNFFEAETTKLKKEEVFSNGPTQYTH